MLSDKHNKFVWVALSKYPQFKIDGVNRFNTTDIDRIKLVRGELGMSTKICRECVDELERFVGEIYELQYGNN